MLINDLVLSSDKFEFVLILCMTDEFSNDTSLSAWLPVRFFCRWKIFNFIRVSRGELVRKRGKLQKTGLLFWFWCGGLWSITQPAQNIFFRTEHYFRQQTFKSGLLKIDIAGITESAIVDSQVISSFQSMVSDAEIVTISNVNKDVLHAIVSLYIRVRSYTFAKDVIQSNKIQALRKEIMRRPRKTR